MFFGFDEKRELIPKIYENYSQRELNHIFLCQYNASVDNNLKIPFIYAKNANSLRKIFEVYLKDLLCVKFDKIQKICFATNFYASKFLAKKSLIFKEKRQNIKNTKQLLRNYFKGIYFQNKDLFFNFVLDKISKQNPKRNIVEKDNLIIIDQKLALLVYDKMIDTNKLEIENEIQKALSLIKQNSFDKFYIIYPKGENFKHFVEIKHFLCDLSKTMLKLVPYSISNTLTRRKECQ